MGFSLKSVFKGAAHVVDALTPWGGFGAASSVFRKGSMMSPFGMLAGQVGVKTPAMRGAMKAAEDTAQQQVDAGVAQAKRDEELAKMMGEASLIKRNRMKKGFLSTLLASSGVGLMPSGSGTEKSLLGQ